MGTGFDYSASYGRGLTTQPATLPPAESIWDSLSYHALHALLLRETLSYHALHAFSYHALHALLLRENIA